MLGLKLATDPRWVELVESNISEVLTDHAFCEQKALSNAISIVVNYPEHTEIVQQLLEIAQEDELAEFYRELMISEAGHYTTFIKLAKKFFPEKEVDDRWKAFLEFEASVIANYGKKETIHG